MKAQWTPHETNQWREFIDHASDYLEDQCGVRERVRVWRVEFAIQYGVTEFDGKEFVVKVARRLNYPDAIWTLLHELAHVAAWKRDRTKTGHGTMWGMAEAALTRLHEQWSGT